MPWPWVDDVDVLTAAEVNKIAPDGVEQAVAYTPSLLAASTSPTTGTGRRQGRYYRMGKLVWYSWYIAFGSSGISAGSGAYRISLPVTAAQLWVDNRLRCGTGRLVDVSVPTSRLMVCYPISTTALEMVFDSGVGVVSNSNPWTWAASDFLMGTAVYEAM